MTISDAPLADLNRFAAERLGWNWWTRFGCRWFGPPDDWEDLGEPVRACTAEERDDALGLFVSKHDCTPPPDYTKGDGLKMLLERKTFQRLTQSVNHVIRPMGDKSEHDDSRGHYFTVAFGREGQRPSTRYSPDLGRAVLEAFCLSEGWTG